MEVDLGVLEIEGCPVVAGHSACLDIGLPPHQASILRIGRSPGQHAGCLTCFALQVIHMPQRLPLDQRDKDVA